MEQKINNEMKTWVTLVIWLVFQRLGCFWESLNPKHLNPKPPNPKHDKYVWVSVAALGLWKKKEEEKRGLGYLLFRVQALGFRGLGV